jgi:hypothetical protein
MFTVTGRSSVVFVGALALSLVWAASASGQVFGRARITSDSYRVRIVSQFGIPVTIGIFGRQDDATARIRFDGGRTGPDVTFRNLIGGERVICVWDAHGTLLFIADLIVDSSGTLEIPGVMAAAHAAEGRESAAPAPKMSSPDIPRLNIKKSE